MANVLNTDKQIAIIGALAEGSSIRSIERITGVHRDTITRLGVKVGQGCTAIMDAKMRNLSCNRLEVDEIWGFVGKKERNVRMGDPLGVGSVWTWCADVILILHKAKATHVESVPVKEVFQGKTIWDGVVEVFDLTGHPKTNRVYAWAHATDDPKHPWRHVTVLHIPPAISPQTAVQAAIMQEIQSHGRPQA